MVQKQETNKSDCAHKYCKSSQLDMSLAEFHWKPTSLPPSVFSFQNLQRNLQSRLRFRPNAPVLVQVVYCTPFHIRFLLWGRPENLRRPISRKPFERFRRPSQGLWRPMTHTVCRGRGAVGARGSERISFLWNISVTRGTPKLSVDIRPSSVTNRKKFVPTPLPSWGQNV